jgi:hypothetical protein
MRALILERNKRVCRRLVRYFMCAGYKVMAVDDPALLSGHLDGVGLIAADAFDGDLLVRTLAEHPHMRGLLWTAEPMQRSLRHMLDMPRISNICGRRDFDTPPRPWEVLMVARRLLAPAAEPAGFGDFLDWGHLGFEQPVAGTADRDALVARVQRFLSRLGTPGRLGEIFGELAHELLMNAIFDAPVDDQGRPKYAGDRKAELVLPQAEQPLFRLASDGSRVVVQVTDSFGRLERRHVFGGLSRALASGEMDPSHGGAGLGMAICHNATVAMFFDVVAGKKTEVTAILDLEWSVRDLRTQAKSLHYFQAQEK